jgi:uncharacterized membrane protein
MESRAKLLGHPLHQILIVFPLGLLATAVIFDVLGIYFSDSRWPVIAFYMIGAGIIGGLVAAVFGLIDWLAIPAGTRAKRVGAWHGIGNLIVTVLFVLSYLLRMREPARPDVVALLCSFAGAGLALITGWLGGELVNRLGVGVYDDANLNAPNSLRSTPSRETRPHTAS